ncbi:MAG: (d)CMP kinase [Minwuiales bacterium]|nr:(d)CMP kinase [Minwuiales bacterium]
MIVAVDGPVAAGKGTLARRLAAHFGFAYLDTGSLYRATARKVLRTGGDPHDVEAAVAAARSLTPEDLADPALRDEAVGEASSVVAVMPAVRDALLGYQRRFATEPPDDAPGAVLDGRDIGTVVCPDAAVKFFVSADVEVRARRRFEELRNRGISVDYEAVLADLRRRDERDSARATAPLKPAPDAHLLDSTNLDIEAAFRAAKDIVASRL